jgi:hypothetical protein
MIEVFKIGSPVVLGTLVKAVITGVLIREHNYITYECSWWDGSSHHCKWLDEIEVRRDVGSAPMKIGFKHEKVEEKA